MANARRKTSTDTKTERKNVKIDFDKLSIKRSHSFDNGNVSFDMEYLGIMFYRLTVVTTKDGNEFISFPSYESNGKWYNYYYLPISQDDQEKIIDLVFESVDD